MLQSGSAVSPVHQQSRLLEVVVHFAYPVVHVADHLQGKQKQNLVNKVCSSTENFHCIYLCKNQFFHLKYCLFFFGGGGAH